MLSWSNDAVTPPEPLIKLSRKVSVLEDALSETCSMKSPGC